MDAGTPADTAVYALDALLALLQLLLIPVTLLTHAICGHVIAKKLDDPQPWLAWIPVGNLVLFTRLGQRPYVWVIMFFLPILFVVAWIGIFTRIAERLGLPAWIAVGMIFPVANVLILVYLAASGSAPRLSVTHEQPLAHLQAGFR